MYYEEQWIDGWLLWRTAPEGSWSRASDARMIDRLRGAISTIATAALIPEHKRDDAEFLRGAIMAGLGVALTALRNDQ
jgi:hypothetical protein